MVRELERFFLLLYNRKNENEKGAENSKNRDNNND